jgi:purine-binding chemotaxis protein CheW
MTALCTFALADLYLAVAATCVQEILRPQTITRVPLADPTIAGLVNLRGQLVIAVDLRRRLRLAAPAVDRAAAMHVVVRIADGAFSLLVDRVDDVVEVADAQCEPTPATVGAELRRLVIAAYKLPDRVLLALDANRAVGGAS